MNTLENYKQNKKHSHNINCNKKLKTLLNITLAINYNIPTAKLLKFFKKILVEQLNIPKFILFWRKGNQWIVLLKSHVADDDYKNIDIDKLLQINEIEFPFANRNLNVNFDAIIPIIQRKEKVAFLLISDIYEGIGMSPTLVHLQFVQTLTNIIIVAIQNKIYRSIQFRQKQLIKEMQTAAQIQKMLIPNEDTYPKTNYLKIKAFYMPHFAVGGDYYDIIKVNKYEYIFCIADVSGKGVSAALLMANFQANLRSLIFNNPAITLEHLILKLNDIVNSIAKGDRFITLFIAKYNALKGRLIYINAAHPSPLLYDARTKNIIELHSNSVGIGMIEKIPHLKAKKIRLRTASKLLCFTDGFYEPILLDDQQSKKFVFDLIKSETNISDIVQNIVDKIHISKDNKIFFDDVAILGLQFYPIFGRF